MRWSCDLILAGGVVVPIRPKGTALPHASVAIDAGRIAALGQADDIAATWQARRTLDCTGAAILPGFVDAHVHVGMSLLKGYPCDLPLEQRLADVVWPYMSALDAFDAEAAARLACLEMVLAGVTAFADMSPHVAATARAVSDSGLRALLAPYALDDPALLARSVGEAREAESPRLRAALGIQSRYGCSRTVLEQAAALAKETGLPIHVHVAETRREVERGFSVEFLDHLGLLRPGAILAHAIHVGQADLDRIAARDAGIACNPVANAKLGTGIAAPAAMRRHGIPVGLGTDSVAANDRHDPFELMRLAAFLDRRNFDQATLTAWDVLEMATLGGAAVLGLEGEIGPVESGKAADLIVVALIGPRFAPLWTDDPDQIAAHLVFCTGPADVRDVVIAGEILVENRRAERVDAGQILEGADQAARASLARAGLI